MNPDDVASYALDLPEAGEEEPWGPQRPVYKAGGKIFATLAAANASQPDRLSVKCESALALHLYEQYPAVRPGYGYQGPRWHWITVHLDGTVPDEEIAEMISHSWQCVVDGLPRTARDRLRRLHRDRAQPDCVAAPGSCADSDPEHARVPVGRTRPSKTTKAPPASKASRAGPHSVVCSRSMP
ncbi:MmcQ/YjbR family DNA-binding protein [Streptomyces sp. R33]|uniref:MmcQ/YjbR family DNA-binding protein n=1 Tax=Streptomyces sp. R33 TaxID=3238629 RepID=A0AB39XX17_9ACTN